MALIVGATNPKPHGESIIAWANAFSFPIAITALIYVRLRFGHDLSSLSYIALMLFALGLWRILYDGILEPRLFTRHSAVLARQAIYGGVWTSLMGIWLYWQVWSDLGLVVLIAIGLSLWPLTLREALRLRRT